MADPWLLEVRNGLAPQSPLPVFNIINMFYKDGVGESRRLDMVVEASQPLLPFTTWFVTPHGLAGPDYQAVYFLGSLSPFVRLLLWNFKRFRRGRFGVLSLVRRCSSRNASSSFCSSRFRGIYFASCWFWSWLQFYCMVPWSFWW